MDFKILGSLSPMNMAGGIAGKVASGGAASPITNPVTSFGDLVKQAVDSTVAAQKNAEAVTLAVAQGENIPTHTVIQAISKAEMTLETMVTVRDRAVEAYQQILQMPI
ncbi:MAG: flagellar hook-basal body complex protein FliE [Alphaproteobacteria bacterium]